MLLKYCFGVYKFNPTILLKISTILNIKHCQLNEDIQINGDVRLIDEKFKLIGIIPFQEAQQQANIKQKDLVLLNECVEPPVCRICDYSDELAQRFITEIQPQIKKQKPERNLKIGPNITYEDLKNKVNSAQIILKKQKRIMIYLICINDELLQCKNILFKFREMCEDFMKPIGNVRVRDYVDQSGIYKSKDEEKIDQVVIEWDFEKIEQLQPTQPLSQIKLERQINQNFAILMKTQQHEYKKIVKEVRKEIKDIDDDEDEIPEEDLTNEPIFSKSKKKRTIIKSVEQIRSEYKYIKDEL